MYDVDSGFYDFLPLENTLHMERPVLGDCDGDGLEDDIVYCSPDGSMSYYEIPLDGLWDPDNVTKIPGANGSPR